MSWVVVAVTSGFLVVHVFLLFLGFYWVHVLYELGLLLLREDSQVVLILRLLGYAVQLRFGIGHQDL